jgi:hypothetical protein
VSQRSDDDPSAGDLNSVLAPHPFRAASPPSEGSWRPADPPADLPSVSTGEIVAGSAVVVGLAALDAVSGGLIGLLASLPGGLSRERSEDSDLEPRPPVVPADLHLSAAPALSADGLVACTACRRRVDYASMSLSEHGYFCDRCGLLQPAG